MARNSNDVIKALAFIREHQYSFALRCGGHCYEDFSLDYQVILDVSNIKDITFLDNTVVKIGSGWRIGELASYLSKYNLMLPAGTCASVGISGLATGGGIGFSTRLYGLTCDNIKSVEMVLANGQLITASEEENSDLFWAVRGAGGGNFGCITSFTFQVHPLSTLLLYEISYNFDDLAVVLDQWQRWAPFTVPELSSELDIFNSDQAFIITGEYEGTEADLERLLQPILGYQIGIKLWRTTFKEAVEHFTGSTKEPFPYFENKSGFVYQPLPLEAIRKIAYYMARGPRNIKLEMDAFGGRVSELPHDSTAFAHRQALYWVQYTIRWDNPYYEKNYRTWIEQFYNDTKQYLIGAYVNAPDLDLLDWGRAYYGDHLERLQILKRKYDPLNVFKFRQSIPI